MPLTIPMRKIDELLKKRANVVLTDGGSISGYGDLLIYLPINDDTEEEDEFLLFVEDNGKGIYLLDNDIKSFEIINN